MKSIEEKAKEFAGYNISFPVQICASVSAFTSSLWT